MMWLIPKPNGDKESQKTADNLAPLALHCMLTKHIYPESVKGSMATCGCSIHPT